MTPIDPHVFAPTLRRVMLALLFSFLLFPSSSSFAQTPGTISGRVINATGEPLANVTVQLYWVLSGQRSSFPSSQVKTDASGSYVFTDVSSGTYDILFFTSSMAEPLLYIQVSAYHNKLSSFDADRIAIAQGEEKILEDMTIPDSGRVIGTVVDRHGQGIDGINVKLMVSGAHDWEVRDQFVTTSSGEFELRAYYPGKNFVFFSDPSNRYLSEYYDNQKTFSFSRDSFPVAPGQTITISAELKRVPQISGTVTDRDGQPLAGLQVRATEISNFGNPYNQLTFWETTDADGKYLFSSLELGKYYVYFEGNSSVVGKYYDGKLDSDSADIIDLTDADFAVADAVMARYGNISGTVTDSDGNPLSDAFIQSYQYSDLKARNYTTTDSNGNYLLRLESGINFVISYSHMKYEPEFYHDQTTITAANVISVAVDAIIPNINAQLKPGSVLSGVVTDNQNNPLAGIDVRVNKADFPNVSWATYTDATGFYSITLAPGTYNLGFNIYGNEDYHPEYYDNIQDITASRTPLVITTGTNQTINAQLDSAISISGYMTMRNGQPAPNGYVHLYKWGMLEDGPGPYPSDVYTFVEAENGGFYRFRNLPPGQYLVRFAQYSPSYENYVPDYYMGDYQPEYYNNARYQKDATILTIAPKTVITGVNAVMEEYGTLVGTVVNENNVPLPNIEVSRYTERTLGNPNYSHIGPATITDQQGRFSINLSEAPTWLEFSDPSREYGIGYYDDVIDFRNVMPISVTAGMTKSISVQLAQSGYIAGHITDANGQPFEGVTVYIMIHSPRLVDFPWIGNDGFDAVTDANGYYRIDGLTPGAEYRVHFYYGGSTYVYPNPLVLHDVFMAHDFEPVVIASSVGVSDIDLSLGGVNASFSGTPLTGTGSLTVNFTDASLGNVTGYSWDFGDGTSSTEKNPSHTYQPGTYTVTLTVNGGASSDSETKVGYIVVGDTEITEVGMAQGNNGNGGAQPKVGETLYFSATATGSNVQFAWDFGDGNVNSASTSPNAVDATTATGQYVQHVYSAPGNYTITLIARNGINEKVTTRQITIGPAGGGDVPVGALSIDAPSKALVGQSVNLVASVGSGSNVTYSWDFGNGQSGTGAQISHSYTEAGTYTVVVKASNSAGSVAQEVQIIIEHGLHIPRLGR